MKYINDFTKHFTDFPVFTTQDIERFLSSNNAGRTYPKRFAQNMIKNKRMARITRGVYTFKKDMEVVGFAFSPFYYGLSYALSYYDIQEERSNPVIITPKIVRNGIRKIMGINALVLRIPKNMFFGYNFVKGNLIYYPVSDVEKTFIDLVYFNIHLREETLGRLISCLNRDRLKNYLSCYPTRLKGRVETLLKYRIYEKSGPSATENRQTKSKSK